MKFCLDCQQFVEGPHLCDEIAKWKMYIAFAPTYKAIADAVSDYDQKVQTACESPA